MKDEELVEAILDLASELDRGDTTYDEAKIKAESIVKSDRETVGKCDLSDTLDRYTEKDIDKAYNNGFYDAMKKYRTD
jgi:hypothetical protein